MHTASLSDGSFVDIGGQWIGPTQDRMYELAEEYGIRVYPMHVSGKNLMFVRGRQRSYSGTIPFIPNPVTLGSMGWALWRLDSMARTVPPHAPWLADRAEEWDSITLQAWMQKNLPSRDARELLRVGMETVLACEPAEVSLLHVLFYIRSAGGLSLLIDSEGGAQQDRLEGGVQPLAEAICRELSDSVVLEQPVTAIRQTESSVQVETASGTWSSERVIVTVPPPLAARIDYQPPLPADRDQLTQRVFMGSVMKCIAAYPEPFWRQAGFSGQAILSEGPVSAVFDASSEDAAPALLLGFVEAGAARKFARRTEVERRAAVLETFARCFGDQALEPLEYVDQYWGDEEWSRGCYTGVFPPGAWTAHGPALRNPVGRIHWAGTETAETWTGYIEGAVRSGERAAREVLNRLQPAGSS